MSFEVRDSGKRHDFESGMVRDTEDEKVDYTNLLFGPMLKRWAEHLTKAKAKYPDVRPGVPNWTLSIEARDEEAMHRYRRSAFRHFIQWASGDRDEDHAAAVMFNINGFEAVLEAIVERDFETIAEAMALALIDEPDDWRELADDDTPEAEDAYLDFEAEDVNPYLCDPGCTCQTGENITYIAEASPPTKGWLLGEQPDTDFIKDNLEGC